MAAPTYSPLAYCFWSLRVAPGKPWEREDPAPRICRASIGERWVTVWLPRGAKIRVRRPRFQADRGEYSHVYGRGRDNLIEICVPDAARPPEHA